MADQQQAELRKVLRQRRQSLAPSLRTAAEQRIITELNNCAVVSSARTVAAFISINGEVSLQRWLLNAARNHRIALPVIDPCSQSRQMTFHEYRAGDALAPNRFGIPEPAPDTPKCKSRHIDVMLLPVVGFDASGTRLGMGAGYYDRYLGAAKKKPYLLGVAFACQQVERLDRAEWDMPLDAVVTEDGLLEF